MAIDGDRYLDGGVHSPTNLDVVAGGGFDLVVVSSPMSVAADRRCSADLPPRLPGPPRWHASAARSSAPAPEWSSSTAAPNLPQALSRKAIYIVVLIVG